MCRDIPQELDLTCQQCTEKKDLQCAGRFKFYKQDCPAWQEAGRSNFFACPESEYNNDKCAGDCYECRGKNRFKRKYI